MRGVGPVKIELRHASGEDSDGGAAQHDAHAAARCRPDVNLMPLNRGDTATFRWRNDRHMKKWSTQRLTVSQVVNNSAQVDVKHVSGPIAVAASYVFATRLSGVALISGAAQGGDQGEVPEARSARRADGRPAPLLHAVRPDGLRLQPDPARTRRRGRRRGAASARAATGSCSASPATLEGRRRREGAHRRGGSDDRRALDADAVGVPVRQRHAHELLRGRARAGEARLPRTATAASRPWSGSSEAPAARGRAGRPLALAPATAHAQGFAPPTLVADLAFAPPTGIARGDFLAGTITDIPAAVAVDGDRIYTVGRTQGGTGGADIGIIARRSDGALDTGFSDDGKLIVSIAPSTESDIGTGIVVLPDHRLRVVASTDVVPGSSESLDVAILGLNPDGSPDHDVR